MKGSLEPSSSQNKDVELNQTEHKALDDSIDFTCYFEDDQIKIVVNASEDIFQEEIPQRLEQTKTVMLDTGAPTQNKTVTENCRVKATRGFNEEP